MKYNQMRVYLRARKKETGLTFQEIADRTGLSINTVMRNLKVKLGNVEALIKIADVLGMTVSVTKRGE